MTAVKSVPGTEITEEISRMIVGAQPQNWIDFLYNKIVYRMIRFENLECIFNAKMLLKGCEFPFFPGALRAQYQNVSKKDHKMFLRASNFAACTRAR